MLIIIILYASYGYEIDTSYTVNACMHAHLHALQ